MVWWILAKKRSEMILYPAYTLKQNTALSINLVIFFLPIVGIFQIFNGLIVRKFAIPKLVESLQSLD